MNSSPLKTSFRSATHATDSIRNGCTANSKAAKALGHGRPVIRSSTENNSIAEAA